MKTLADLLALPLYPDAKLCVIALLHKQAETMGIQEIASTTNMTIQEASQGAVALRGFGVNVSGQPDVLKLPKEWQFSITPKETISEKPLQQGPRILGKGGKAPANV